MSETPIYQRPAELLQALIRFDTTNPPGNERDCILYICDLLAQAGIESTLIAKDEHRPNLIARIKGRGEVPPLLLYGHVDVVTTENQPWTHPPFGAEIHDGYIWGRGALDMKSAVAMFITAFLKAHVEQISLPGDVILCVVSDEEAGGDWGAKFLCEEHRGLFEGVSFALGEFGGFSLELAGKRFYPIMVAEKQVCWTIATIRGPGGHGSQAMRHGTAARLGKFLSDINARRMPVHITPAVKLMIEALAAELPFTQRSVMRQLLNPTFTDRILDVLGEQGRLFDPLLHHTANATMFTGSSKINVLPGEIKVGIDGRLLPGFQPEDLLGELRTLGGDDIEYEVFDYNPGPPEPNMALFDTLGDILRQDDPDGAPIPLVLPGVTDGRFFGQIGIQTYGFTPMQLPTDYSFMNTIHAADERVPVEAVGWGAERVLRAMQRFGEAK